MDPPFQFGAGDRLDSFEIVAPLYAGALAQVYHGVDRMTHQDVVIKVPSMDIINNPVVYYHFQNESRILATLHHPRIVRYVQRDRSSAYHIFEYIPGMDLRSYLLSRKRLTFSKAKHYTAQTAQGLLYLHNCGILHLDIKPENLIVTTVDTVKIIDFGLAWQVGVSDMLRKDYPKPHGTPYYVAPEQLVRGRVDARTDLYSLAMVYYELLTGHLPFEKHKDPVRLKRRLKVDPVPPRYYRPEIPVTVEQFILTALSSEPEKRPASANEFMQALDRATQPITAQVRKTDPSIDLRQEMCPLVAPYQQSARAPGGILVALDDDPYVDAVTETALQEAVVNGAGVTLLSVIDGDEDDDWNRYGDEVRGKLWGHRLERIANRFRSYGIEPVVRILSGVPSDNIITTARDNRSDLIIMGASNKNVFKRLIRGSTLGRIIKRSPCPVMVAEHAEPPAFPVDATPDTLTMESLGRMEYFLSTLWAQQLDWLGDLIQNGLADTLAHGEFEPEDNPIALWAHELKRHPQWGVLLQWMNAPIAEFNRTAALMVTAAGDRRQARLGRLYLERALPLLCRMWEGIQKISTMMRTKYGTREFTKVQLLSQTDCPIYSEFFADGGPVRRLQTLGEYFRIQYTALGQI